MLQHAGLFLTLHICTVPMMRRGHIHPPFISPS